MSKERTDPSGDARNPLNQQANNRTKKNQKHLKYALSLISESFLDSCLARYSNSAKASSPRGVRRQDVGLMDKSSGEPSVR